MNYVKLTPEVFAQKLSGGEYQDLTGARRAIGKASWPETKKASAREAAEKFFGGSAPKKAATKKADKAEKVKKVKKAAKKAVESDSSEDGVGSVGYANSDARLAQGEVHDPRLPRQLSAADIKKNPFHAISIAEHAVGQATSVINALTAMKVSDPSVNISEPTEAAIKTIKGSLSLTALVISGLFDGMNIARQPAPAAEKPAATNGVHTDPTPGQTIYEPPTQPVVGDA
jgi:hypothetical protein